MASRILFPTARAGYRAITPRVAMGGAKSFHTSRALSQEVVAPVRRPVGAFRGGIFGFLLGATFAGAAMYYYVVDEYRISNELLTEDIYALQSAVERIEAYVKTLEERLDAKKIAKK